MIVIEYGHKLQVTKYLSCIGLTAIEKQQFASLHGQHHADIEDCIEYEESHGNDNADEMINFVVQIHKILEYK